MVSKLPLATRTVVWKTRTTTKKSGNGADQSPLMSYPLILRWTLEFLNMWDVLRLLHAGNARCTALIQQHCTRLHGSSEDNPIEWLQQPTLGESALSTILRFPNLTELVLISPTWKMSVSKPRSPLEGLPKTLRHLTVWGAGYYSDDGFVGFSNFVDLDYATLFPTLETLRLCSVAPPTRSVAPVQPLDAQRFPPNLRILSLIGFPTFFDADAYIFCQPVDWTTKSEVVELPANATLADVAAATSSSPDAPATALTHRFANLEFFEWGGSYLVGQEPMPHPQKGEVDLYRLPLGLHTYRRVVETILVPLPASVLYVNETVSLGDDSQIVAEKVAISLKTLVLEELHPNEQIYRKIPSSITSMRLLGIRRRTGVFHQIDFMRFPLLRTLCCNMGTQTDVLARDLPDTIESLTFDASVSASEQFKAPSALQHVSAKAEGVAKFLKIMPHTITSLYLSLPGPERVFRQGIVQSLPPTLRVLHLNMKTFPSDYIQLIPKNIEDLSIKAYSMLYSDWLYEGKITEFDISQLPPALTRLRIITTPQAILLPASKLNQLPRSLKFVEISNVTLSTSTVPPPSISAATSSSSSSSASSSSPAPKAKSKPGLFGKIAKLFAAAPVPTVTPQQLEYVLSMLPEDCWCNIGFSLDTDMNLEKQESSDPSSFLPLLARTLPAPIVISRGPLTRHTELQFEY